MNGGEKLMGLVHEKAYSDTSDHIQEEFERGSDVIDGLEWGIMSDPKGFDLVEGTEIYIAKSKPIKGPKDDSAYIVVYFRILDADTVNLLEMEII
jgi:hypothetical protein